jgi:hypothetical protein
VQDKRSLTESYFGVTAVELLVYSETQLVINAPRQRSSRVPGDTTHNYLACLVRVLRVLINGMQPREVLGEAASPRST